jgi:hypothetical protein
MLTYTPPLSWPPEDGTSAPKHFSAPYYENWPVITSFIRPISYFRKRDCNVGKYFAYFLAWVWNLVYHIKVRTQAESVYGQFAAMFERRPVARRALHPLGMCKISAHNYADQKWPPWRRYHEADPRRKISRASIGSERKQPVIDT